MLILASFVIIVAGMKAAESIIVPFLLALFIAIIALPPFLWLQQKKVSKVIACLLSFFVSGFYFSDRIADWNFYK